MAPKLLVDTRRQLANSAAILGEVERDPALRSSAIFEQLSIIETVAAELKQILQSMASLQRKSTLRQSLHAFVRRSTDATALNDVLNRLETAKAELLLRINVAHVGMTRGIAEHIGVPVNGTGPSSDNKPKLQYQLLLDRNESDQDSVQMNGILGFDDPKLGANISVTENKALGKSRQTNIVSGRSNSVKWLLMEQFS